MDASVKTIDEFIAKYPDDIQIILRNIRQAIHEVVPQAREKISYGIPTFELNEKNLVHFSAYEKHIGFYPGAQAIVDFAEELKTFETSKGTVRFLIDKPMPLDLIKRITKYCVELNKKDKKI